MKRIYKIGILNKVTVPDIERTVLGDNFEISCLNVKHEDELPYSISQYDAVILSHRLSISESTISKLHRCKVIVCASVGYDNIDYNYATECNIRVFNVPDYGTNDVADHAFALLLTYARRILLYDQLLRNDFIKNWDAKLISGYHRLTGLTVGIIGLGRIGTAFALRAKAFGMNVIFYDPYKESGYERALQVERVDDLYTIFERCNIISLHTPLTNETVNMINETLLNHSKNTPIIINTARGALVNSTDICNALYSGKIDAYLSDVIEREPPTSQSVFLKYAKDPILSTKIIITPHSASYAEESKFDMRYKAAETVLKALSNKEYKLNCVNMGDLNG